MSLKIRKQIVNNLSAARGKGNKKLYLTIHQTDNTGYGANAAAHANLQSRLWPNATWHWTVDDKEAVQSFEHDVQCWHAGDGRNGVGNTDSIAIEFCLNSDGDYEKAFDNTARLAAKILKEEDIPLTRMVQHNKWSGKNCPSRIRKDVAWNRFVTLTERYMRTGTTTPSLTKAPTLITPDGYWGKDTTYAAQYLCGTTKDSIVSSQATIWKGRMRALTGGWEWVVDPKGSLLIRKLQKIWKVDPDGILGPGSVRGMQKHLGTQVTGSLGGNNGSGAVRAFQNEINKALKSGKKW